MSPCNKICKINNTGLCIGCYRTLDEISVWRSLSTDQQEMIIKELATRKNDIRNKRTES